MPSISDIRRAFRARLADKKIAVAPGTGDALGARLIQAAGFDAVYMSGYAVEGTFGKPDVGLVTQTEMAARAAQMADAVEIPIIADADTGYGDVINVVRTVREFERAGVTALQLEDQPLPKRCAAMSGKELVTTEEMVGKIKAAADTRVDPNLLIIGRTDIDSASKGIDATLARLSAYSEAGADLLLAMGPFDRKGAERLIKESPRPFIYMNAETFTKPMIPVAELERLGAKLVVFPISLVFAAAYGIRSVLEEIKKAGTTAEFCKHSMLTWKEFNQLVGLGDIEGQRSRYGQAAGKS
jgi:2-methylisocitrate lyase-like PEP mutase family enzyme